MAIYRAHTSTKATAYPTLYPNMIRIATKIQSFLLWLLCHLSTEFCNNRSCSFCIILLTNKQTNKQTSADENITSLVEMITKLKA